MPKSFSTEEFSKFCESSRDIQSANITDKVVETAKDDKKIYFNFNLARITRECRNLSIKHKNTFRTITNLTSMFVEAKNSKSILFMANAVVRGFIELNGADRYYHGDYFCRENGWHMFLASDFYYFDAELKELPFELFEFSYTAGLSIRITELLGSKIAYCLDKHNEVSEIYCRDVGAAPKLLEYLANRKMAKMDCNAISIVTVQGPNGVTKEKIVPEVLFSYPSKREEDIRKALQAYMSAGINRSIILHGPPGTGKTTISQTMIANLGIRSLKIKCGAGTSISNRLLMNIVNLFKIDAVLLDDFEYQAIPTEMLELLELLNKEVKLVIGIVNNMHDLAPALTRPGRFDEIIEISTLEPTLVEGMLGDLYEEYGEAVVSWPVAYINEFIKRTRVLGRDNIDETFAELKARAEAQLLLFGKKTVKATSEKEKNEKVSSTKFRVIKGPKKSLSA